MRNYQIAILNTGDEPHTFAYVHSGNIASLKESLDRHMDEGEKAVVMWVSDDDEVVMYSCANAQKTNDGIVLERVNVYE